jgi:hypothetical protein
MNTFKGNQKKEKEQGMHKIFQKQESTAKNTNIIDFEVLDSGTGAEKDPSKK